ncbi:hypothetical protein KY289_014993 [Solanum tuberosum]|nr:hypothetical protein KY289_014993 [Solanum tuberosum]
MDDDMDGLDSEPDLDIDSSGEIIYAMRVHAMLVKRKLYVQSYETGLVGVLVGVQGLEIVECSVTRTWGIGGIG